MKNKNLRLWHYTPAHRLIDIIESGHIKFSIDTFENEKPVVWFSSNPVWENSVVKYVRTEESEKQLITKESMLRICGLGRIEVKYTEEIITWQLLKEYNGVNPECNDFFEMAGDLFGGNPTEWYASHTQCDMKNWLKIEIWKNELWQPFEYKDSNKKSPEHVWNHNSQIIDE